LALFGMFFMRCGVSGVFETNESEGEIRMLRNELLEQVIQEHAEKLVKEAGESWPEKLEAIVEHPGNMEHGEYSTNMAMKLAKTLRKPPVAIAEQLKLRLEEDDRLAVIQRIERKTIGSPLFSGLRWLRRVS